PCPASVARTAARCTSPRRVMAGPPRNWPPSRIRAASFPRPWTCPGCPSTSSSTDAAQATRAVAVTLRAMDPALAELADRIRAAAAQGTPLRIHGGGTKDFYGERLEGELLDTRGLQGI